MREQSPSAEQAYQPHLLVAEDDVPLAELLKHALQADHCAVDVVHDGEAAFRAARGSQYDLLIMDLNLPKLDGMALLRQLRPLLPRLPVLVLTGRPQFEDRLTALESGANDCLIKPFSFPELTARARVLMHRSDEGRSLQVGDLRLDREQFRVERAGKRIALTPKEFLVLECLMINAQRAVTRAMIMEYVWKTPYDAHSNLVDVYVKYVRDKIDAGFPTRLLRTIRGIGYTVADD